MEASTKVIAILFICIAFFISSFIYGQGIESTHREKPPSQVFIAIQPVSPFRPVEKKVFSTPWVLPIELGIHHAIRKDSKWYWKASIPLYFSKNYLNTEYSHYSFVGLFSALGYQWNWEKWTIYAQGRAGIGLSQKNVIDKSLKYHKSLSIWQIHALFDFGLKYSLTPSWEIFVENQFNIRNRFGCSIGTHYIFH